MYVCQYRQFGIWFNFEEGPHSDWRVDRDTLEEAELWMTKYIEQHNKFKLPSSVIKEYSI